MSGVTQENANLLTDASVCSLARLRVLAKLCRNRGGTCDCVGRCKANELAQNLSLNLEYRKRQIESEIEYTENITRRINAPMATLRDGFKFKAGMTPVAVFDCGEVSFGYENDDGDWIEDGEWPFNESVVWPDDFERHGVRVE